MAGPTSQNASSDGHHNIIVQASGDGIHVEIGLPHLALVPVAARLRREPQRDIDILNPVYQSVPLVGRDEDLRFLLAWLVAEPRIAVTALIGRGGSGKTRLALELLQQLPAGWQGGFLTQEEAQRFHTAANLSQWGWQRPTLIVADYAALMTDALQAWFSELADHGTPEHPLRILLLERHADEKSGWYRDLADQTWHGEAVGALFSPREPRTVRPLDPDGERRAVLRAGIDAAYALAPEGTERPSLPDAGADGWVDRRLLAAQWADPLLLLMAGVISVSHGLSAALGLSRPDLAKRLACRERARVRRAVEDHAAQDVLAHLYACVTMCGGLSREHAGAVAEAEMAVLRKSYPGGAGQAVDDLARVLGAGAVLPPVAPDLLAGALLIETLGTRAPGVAGRLATLAPGRVAATWIRATQDFAPGGDSLPLECLEVLSAKAIEELAVLVAIEENLPKNTIAIRRLAVTITQELLRHIRELDGESQTSTDRRRVAHLLNNLALRQGDMGMRQEALGSATEAVRLFRALAEANPDAFEPNLAGALNNLSTMQSATAQGGAALSSIAEAVRLYRALAEANPDAFRPQLAGALNNLAGRLGEIGQREAALSSMAEAVHLYRDLARANPNAFWPDLAGAVNNLAGIQSNMGQRGAALSSIAEAVRLYRDLAEANPDAFLPDLARSLANLSNGMSDVGQRGEALSVCAEAVELFRHLEKAHPDAFRPDLASALSNLAVRQSAMGQRGEALSSVADAVALYRRLAEVNREAFRSALASSLNNLSLRQNAVGQSSEALSSIAEAVRLYRALARGNPDAFRPNLAGSLGNLSLMQSNVCQRDGAFSSSAETARLYRALADENSDAFLPDLALALNNHALRQIEMGQLCEALSSIAEAVGLYRDLAKTNPGAFRPAVARSLGALGQCLRVFERFTEARAAVAEALDLLAEYYARYPAAHEGLVRALLGDYAEYNKALGVAMDPEVLRPYESLL